MLSIEFDVKRGRNGLGGITPGWNDGIHGEIHTVLIPRGYVFTRVRAHSENLEALEVCCVADGGFNPHRILAQVRSSGNTKLRALGIGVHTLTSQGTQVPGST